MFKSLIKVSIRKIRKEPGYSLIIIISLTIGIVSSLFLLLYVFDDLSFDQYHMHKDRIVRVLSDIQPDHGLLDNTQIPFGQQAKEDYPEIENFVRFVHLQEEVFIYNDVKLWEYSVFYADSSVFEIFTYDLVKGDAATALARPNTMVVTRSFANKYFGGEDPYGKTIRTSSGGSFEVTGIMEDVPENSHRTFTALISKTSLPARREGWDRFGCSTYLLLSEGTDRLALQEKMKEMCGKYMAGLLSQRNWDNVEHILEPLTEIYFKSDAEGYGYVRHGNLKYVYVFSFVAFLMLLIAGINYMNLATSRSISRAKEVGLRKITGSQRWPLILQFLSESVLFTVVALVISIVIIIVLLPSFNQIAGRSFDLHSLLNTRLVLSLIGIIIFIGIIGGIYPAVYLASFNPASVIKQEIGAGKSNFILRKILVILQFAISLAIIISSWMMHRQVRYMKDLDLGFDKHNVVIVDMVNWTIRQQIPVFQELLKAGSGIQYVSSAAPLIGYPPAISQILVETPDGMQPRAVNIYTVDYDFAKALGIEIIRGRDFSRDFSLDTISSVIINETMARQFGWEEPLGKVLKYDRADIKPFRVVGVMSDFHHLGAYGPIEPLMLMLWNDNPIVTIKISDQNVRETLQFIESKWKEVLPDHPFELHFLDDLFAEQYNEDETKGKIFLFFSILVILIAGMGMVGLASFTAEQRTHELAIRKVLGASAERIILLMLSEFILLVLISMIPAFIAAYYYMKAWLQDFTYPVGMNAWMFIGTGLLGIFLALISVAQSTIKSGLTNPAESLRV